MFTGGATAATEEPINDAWLRANCGRTSTGVWDRTLILTYSEFGRRRVRTKAAAPITAPGRCWRQLRHTTDFRRVYASVLERLWQLACERVL